MKRALLVLAGVAGGLVVLVLAAIAVLLLVVDPNDYKSDIAAAVKKKTGLVLTVSDRMGWSVWPGIGVSLGKVALTDPVARETLLSVDKAAVSVRLLPLLSRRIAVDAVLLDGARVQLIQHVDGTTSWDTLFSKQQAPGPDKEASSSGSGKVAFNVSKLDVKNSALLLKDEKAGSQRAIDSIEVSARDIGDGAAFPLHLGFVFRQQQADGKTLSATTALDARVRMDADAQRYDISSLLLKTALSGTQMPNAPGITVKGNVHADLAAKQARVDALRVDVTYPPQDGAAPMTLGLAGDAVVVAWGTGDLEIPGLVLSASVPGKSWPKPLLATLSAPVKGNWKQGTFSVPAFAVDAAGVHTQGALEARLPAMAATEPGTPVTRGMTLTGSVVTAAFSPRAAMAAIGMTPPRTADANVLKTASFSADLRGDEKQVLLRNIRLTLDDSTLSGEAGIGDLVSMRQYARLALDRMDADRYLAQPVAPEKKAAPAAAAAAGGVLPVELLKKQNLDVVLTAGSLKAMTYPVSSFRLAATAANGIVTVGDLRGTIFNGGFSVPVTINVQGAQPVVRLQPKLEHMEIGPLATKILKKDLLAGKASYNGDLTLRGNTSDAWMQSVSGSSSLKLENGVLHGVNAMKELTGALGKYQGLLALTGKDAATLASSQSDTDIASFASDNALDHGVVTTKTLDADLRKARVAGSGTLNLVSQELDYRFALNLDKSVAGERSAAYALPVRCKGNLAGRLASLCSLDSGAVRDMMLKAAASKGLEKLGLKAGGAGAGADVKQKAEEEKQKAREKLNEKLNEGLNRLFKR